jgi:transcriptional regulator with XRE-family HTH domain
VISTAVTPLQTFLKGYQEEVERYEALKQGRFVAGRGLSALGKILVEARIAAGMSQRELAEKLGVHESSVSRDERNDYYGVTVDRACRILQATGTRVQLSIARKASEDDTMSLDEHAFSASPPSVFAETSARNLNEGGLSEKNGIGTPV